MGGRGRGRGGRGGRGGANGGGAGAGGGPNGPSPVDFSLLASPSFVMDGCPAEVKAPIHSGALYRLTMHDRAVLGDIVLWFAAAAVAEPTARLVMWQATRQDKTWLSGYVQQSVPQLEVATVEINNNKYVQFKLFEGILPPPPPPPKAAAAAAQQAAAPAPAAAAPAKAAASPAAAPAAAAPAAAAAAKSPADQVKEAATATAQHTKEAATAAAAKVQEVAKEAAAAVHHAAEGASAGLAVAGQKAKEHAAAAGDKAKAAAAAAREGLSDAAQQMNGATEAAADTARTWLTEVQAAYTGEKGPRAQQVALGSTVAAAALAVVGIAAGVLFGRRGRR